MTKPIFALLALCAALAVAPTPAIAQVSPYPSIVFKNQFGEETIGAIIGGSNQIDCNFIVDATNGNGLGIRSLKGPGCKAVYMHTSATPASGNPNPPSGYILVQLAANYSGYVGGYSGTVSPVSGTAVNVTSGLSANSPYIITSVGTTTQAQWAALGLPAGVIPNVGASFIAITSSPGAGTGVVEAPLATGSAISSFDVIGDANQEVGGTGGAWIMARTLAATSSGVTTLQATAPVNNSVIGMRFVLTALPSQLK